MVRIEGAFVDRDPRICQRSVWSGTNELASRFQHPMGFCNKSMVIFNVLDRLKRNKYIAEPVAEGKIQYIRALEVKPVGLVPFSRRPNCFFGYIEAIYALRAAPQHDLASIAGATRRLDYLAASGECSHPLISGDVLM